MIYITTTQGSRIVEAFFEQKVMVCKKCILSVFFDLHQSICPAGEKKLHRSVVPEVWKDGARNADVGKGRAVGVNMAADKKQMQSKRYSYCPQRVTHLHSPE